MSKPKPMVVAQVNMGAVKIALVDKALELHAQPVGGTDEQKVKRLAAWYADPNNTPKARLADCSTCGGESDVNEPACPFCGDGETAPSAPAPAGTSGRAATEPAPKATKAAPAPPAGMVRVDRSVPKVPRPGLPIVAESEAARLQRLGEEARAAEEVILPQTEEALDGAVKRIGDLMWQAADRMYELGTELKGVFNQALWRQRKNSDGTDRYKSWGHFCEAELGISHGYSLKIMDVAENFTREELLKIGASKLYITLSVPKGEARDRLLGLAPTTPKAELAKLAKEAAETPRETGRKGKGGAGTHKGGPALKGGRKPEKITVAMLTNRIEMIPVAVNGKQVKMKIGPLACEERLFNGVKQRIVVTNNEDGHVLVVVERVRE